jgi:hypothetical protein
MQSKVFFYGQQNKKACPKTYFQLFSKKVAKKRLF